MSDKESSVESLRETFEVRLMRLEDRYNELAVKVAKLDTKMNFLSAIGSITMAATVSVLLAVLFHL